LSDHGEWESGEARDDDTTGEERGGRSCTSTGGEESRQTGTDGLVMMALVWGGTLNSSTANLSTAVKGGGADEVLLHLVVVDL
jgi:hypothetical protein